MDSIAFMRALLVGLMLIQFVGSTLIYGDRSSPRWAKYCVLILLIFDGPALYFIATT